MSDHHYNQNILIGAAVAAGILGTLTSLLGFNKNGKNLSAQAKNLAHQVMDSTEIVNKKMVLGGVAGGLVGAAAALLLAPKAGSELIKDMVKPFSNDDHSHHHAAAPKKNHRKPASSKKSASTVKAEPAKKSSKTVENKTRKAAAKKSPARRRPTVASKAAAAVEKVANEVKES